MRLWCFKFHVRLCLVSRFTKGSLFKPLNLLNGEKVRFFRVKSFCPKIVPTVDNRPHGETNGRISRKQES